MISVFAAVVLFVSVIRSRLAFIIDCAVSSILFCSSPLRLYWIQLAQP